MARKTVNPTRMELTRLKGRLRTARRGHKLLKDKRDELMRQFLAQVRMVQAMRAELEGELAEAYAALDRAAAVLPPEFLGSALLCPGGRVELTVAMVSRMGVALPEFSFSGGGAGVRPYGVAQTSAALDDALGRFSAALSRMLELAGGEKAVQLMAREIETTRRRVNAMEYVMIPELEENIRIIAMKLEENERGSIVRLMKVKDMILKEAIEARRARSAPEK